ncbi:hypothetical protein OAA60_06595, partial [Porticoccaceae bacterium]|nr:hypothetical protein [Porticoccaceae bacterium]
MTNSTQKLILFAAACFAVPVLVSLIVLVVLSFSNSVTNIAMPLMTLMATVFAAYAAWQSASAIKEQNHLQRQISLAGTAIDLIDLL